jgi:hypothetical protein
MIKYKCLNAWLLLLFWVYNPNKSINYTKWSSNIILQRHSKRKYSTALILNANFLAPKYSQVIITTLKIKIVNLGLPLILNWLNFNILKNNLLTLKNNLILRVNLLKHKLTSIIINRVSIYLWRIICII